ncbi:hypothetical protein CN423_27025 [Bacillus cereus]|uniref:hypothetical protein n=1 Tax=Bacillus cereus TaxID=1396 RepID=UPI000BF856DF|nr:hypothetical protein [Bacillus cereus]PEV57680.1 hypothetical protein CN423_27025 [Bacillus cereus]
MQKTDKHIEYKTTSFYKKLSKQIIILISLLISLGYELGVWDILLTEHQKNQLLNIVMAVLSILSTLGILLPDNKK